MTDISIIAGTIADRVEIAELFARYCHSVDHGDAAGWAALFTDDGSFEVVGVMQLAGHDQLKAMPGIVAQHGGGKWRHQITNIITEHGDDPNHLQVRAYGLVTDWRDGGKPASFTDYAVTLRREDGGWKIAKLTATMP